MKKYSFKLIHIINALLVVLVIVLAGLLVFIPREQKYVITNEEMLECVLSKQCEVFPEDVFSIIEYGDTGYFFIDVRTPHQYQIDHLEGAINLPIHDFLDEGSIEMFDQLSLDSTTVIIYGNDQLQANGGWMLLRQLGYQNIKVMMGGWDYYTTGPLDLYDMPEIPEYLIEEPAYDFAGDMESMGNIPVGDLDTGQPEMVVPVRKKKKVVAEGGC